MEQYICTVSPFVTVIFSVKDWPVNIFPIAIQDHSMLWNLALHTQATAFQRMNCKKINLNRIFYRSNRLSLQLNRPLRNTRITFAFCFGQAWAPYSCNGHKHRCKHVSDSVPGSFDTRKHFDYIASLTGIVMIINCSISSSCNDRSNH